MQRRKSHKNDCDMNSSMNRFNECTMNKKVEDVGCSNVVNRDATITNDAAPITPSHNKPTTLILQFSHSTNTCTATVSNDDDTINSPLDIYRKFGMVLMII